MINTMTKTADINSAFETTYQIIIGDMSIEMLVKKEASVNLLYDPFELSKVDFVAVVKWLLEHYIEEEEYLRCAKLRDILIDKDSHDDILKEIVLDENDQELEFYAGDTPIASDELPTSTKDRVLDALIDTLKNMDQNIFASGFKDFIKNAPLNDITDSEMWSIMTKEDKAIFKDKFADFYKWVSTLQSSIRDGYILRLLDDEPLIPEDLSDIEMQEEYFSDDMDFEDEDELDEIDYVNNVVVSFLDGYTIMSHTNKKKLMSIKSDLIFHGIFCIDVRQKDNVYSLVYDSTQKPSKPFLN